MKKESLFMNAIALVHINKTGGEMLKDFESLMKTSGENRTVAELLKLSGEEFLLTNANEAMTTGQAGFGLEFIEASVLSNELIERISNSDSLLAKAMTHTMNANVQKFPVRGARIRMIGTTESNSLPGTTPGVDSAQVKKAGTAELTLTANEFVVTVYFSDTLLEDSVVGIAEYVTSEIVAAYERSLHEVVLNGDTDTGASTNINIIDGNTSALPDGNKTDLLKANGARKVAIDNTATVNAGAAMVLEDIRSARALLGIKGLNPADLVLVPDQSTYFKLLNLSQAETVEKFGDAATVKEGRLVAIDGIAIVNREEILKATATGEISATGSNNTKGQMALIHLPSLHIGFRRQLSVETSRYAEQRQTGVTGSTRFAVTFDNTQNSTQASLPAALIVNI